MDRKKTILIAVLVNAGLLVLLFVVALHRDEAPSKGSEIVQVLPQENQPLFNDVPMVAAGNGDAPLAENTASLGEETNALTMPAVSSALTASDEIVHQLPSLAPEEPIAAEPAAPIPASKALSSVSEVKVKKGDSLEKIARAHRTSVDELIRINQLPSSFLRVGQVLKIPAAVTHHSKTQKGTNSDLKAGSEYYTVKVGDNPWTIAMKHHMRVDELLKVNHLNEEKARRLKPGDRLRVR